MRVCRSTLVAVIAVIGLQADTRAQSSGGPYEIPTQTVVVGGGGRSGGLPYAVEGSIGQAAVGPSATGGAFELLPGFRRERQFIDGVFVDGFEDP